MAGVSMLELKRYDGFAYLLCDGEDPEGNVFQLSQTDWLATFIPMLHSAKRRGTRQGLQT